MMKLLSLWWCVLVFLAHPTAAAVLTVTNTAATGPGTLHAALATAATNMGPDSIVFNIPSPDPNRLYYQDDDIAGSLTLVASTVLPDASITDFDPDYLGTPFSWFRIQPDPEMPLQVVGPVTIDGTTQPGYAGKPVVELHGNDDEDGLLVETFGCVIRGLVVNGFNRAAIHFQGPGAFGNAVFGCYLGTDPSGTLSVANSYGVLIDDSARLNTIGGPSAEERNLISGNLYTGIAILAPAGTTLIRGNWIGTDVTGTNALGNEDGIYLTGATNIIGGDTPDSANVISGYYFNGIRMSEPTATRNVIVGNMIGVDVTGTQGVFLFVEQTLQGIFIHDGADGNVIGAGSPGSGNVISVYAGTGIRIEDSSRQIIRGNRLGTDVTGRAAMYPGGASSSGLVLVNSHQNIIGGLESDDRNVISGNGSDGIVLALGSSENTIQGNFIGTDIDGLLAIPNSFAGIYCGGSHNFIGGSEAEARNIISANLAEGIWLADLASSNQVNGNFIGLGADGATHLGNEGAGVLIGSSGFSQANLAGGFGGFSMPEGGAGNSLRANSIFANGGLGIDLGGDGITSNDFQDDDSGPNQLQNYPQLSSVTLNPEGTLVQIVGMLNSAPNQAFEIEFFASTDADPSGHGEGQHYLGTTTVMTGGAGHAGFNVSLTINPAAGSHLTATATDENGNTSEFSGHAPLTMERAPEIITQPSGTNVAPGTTIHLCVEATGSPAPEYQWRHNGVAVPGETNSCLTIFEAQATDGGTYSVVVANREGTISSHPVLVLVDIPGIPAGDNFNERGTLSGAIGLTSGTNNFATREAGERLHAGKPGGKSMWYRWVAPASGVATFSTAGSSFDTLLAIYRGGSLSNLVLVAEDEDGGGFLTSLVRLNVEAGVEYQIAIDGFVGDAGRFVLGWILVEGQGQIPRLLTSPRSQTVGQESNHTFTVDAEGEGLTYQWYFNGQLLPGATNASLTVSNVQTTDLGEYYVRVQSGDLFVDSPAVSLQINFTGVEVQPVVGLDKFQDAVLANNPIRLGTPLDLGAGAGSGRGGGALSRGYSGTHTFNTYGSQSQPGEPNHCGVVGGASLWFTYLSEEPGQLFVNTDGSNFDTVLAIYTGTGSSFSSLQEQACDNNSGLDGLDSSTNAAVSPGIIYYIVVDGVKAATGLLKLNYALVTSSRLAVTGFNAQRQPLLQLRGRAEMKFVLQGSSNFLTWTDLINTNSATAVFNFIDQTVGGSASRFYRARMLP